jgi:deazaflavin-dependent oxidoreductase (nitroreductase family)
MPLPHAVATFNRKFTNRALSHLSGFGPFAEIEHVGRRSGRVHRTVILAFRRGDLVTIALTYGPDVDWLRNIETAGGARLHCGSEVLDLGPVVHLSTVAGRARMPWPVRVALRAIAVTEFVELPVRSANGVANGVA